MSALVVWLNTNAVIDGTAKSLLALKVSFGSLDRDMSCQESNLIQFAVGEVTETGAGATKIMRSEVLDIGASRSPPNNIPKYLGCHSITRL